jgi:hypothetical protein
MLIFARYLPAEMESGAVLPASVVAVDPSDLRQGEVVLPVACQRGGL